MKAGAFKAEITPYDLTRTYLAGFGFGRRAHGVLDPLWARVLYLQDGDTEVAVAALDLIGITRDTTERIRAKVKTVAAGAVHVCCTHAHSGPDTIGLWGPAVGDTLPYASGVDPAYMEFLEDEVAYAVDKAKANARDASVSLAVDDSPKEKWSRNVREPADRDDRLTAIRFTAGGDTLATVVHFGSHPEALWDKNHLVSADYAGVVAKTVERAFGGVGIFWNGALGGMVTIAYDEEMPEKRRQQWMKEAGGAFGGLAADALREKAVAIPSRSFSVATTDVPVPMDNRLFLLAKNLGIFQRQTVDDAVVVPVTCVSIGPVNIALFPGEPLPAVGSRVRRILGGDYPLLVSLSDDEIGYVLESAMFDDPRYAYEVTMTLGRKTADLLCGALESIARP